MGNNKYIDIYVTYSNIIYRHILKNHEAFLQLNSSAETKSDLVPTPLESRHWIHWAELWPHPSKMCLRLKVVYIYYTLYIYS